MEFEGVLLMEKELEQYVLSLLADYPRHPKKLNFCAMSCIHLSAFFRRK